MIKLYHMRALEESSTNMVTLVLHMDIYKHLIYIFIKNINQSQSRNVSVK